MTDSRICRIIASFLAAAVLPGCGSTRSEARGTISPASTQARAGDSAYIAKARADSLRHPYTVPDIQFMSRMIGHHAQAIRISNWAPTHGASPEVRTLAARIINAQDDEIATMQRWLRDRLQPVPDPEAPDQHGMVQATEPHTHAMEMDGPALRMQMMHMPGMLTEAQMNQLNAARGARFDRLFLTMMIQHHRGAVAMVKDLFGSYGAAQDETVFKFASDVNVDQTTEVERMEKMLAALPHTTQP